MPDKWRDSQAKAILWEALLSGKITEAMGPKEVFQLNDEFKKFKYENFRSNLLSMRKSLKDGSLLKKKTVKWGKSDAKRLLRDDIITQVLSPVI